MIHACQNLRRAIPAWALCVFLAPCAFGQEGVDELKKELQELRDQNRALQSQLQQQQQKIDDLTRKFAGVQETNQQLQSAVQSIQANPPVNAPGQTAPEKPPGFSLGNVAITGEGAAGIFETGANGKDPNAAFRVPEARLFFDTPVWDDIFFHAQVDIVTPESADTGLYFGEIYLEFEDLLKKWNLDDLLNVRLGNIYVPFGEEYQYRFAIDDPLISHSLSDIWGYSPGLELYGSWKHLSYAIAVQDGGFDQLNDNTADKSIAGRIGFDPLPWLHLSASGLRTGDLVAGEDLSEIWFGGGFFKSIGAPITATGAYGTTVTTTTTTYGVTLGELDATGKWKTGYLKAAGGYASYSDNNIALDDHRDIYYYYVEGLQHATGKLYGVARWSQIRAGGGYPIEGDTETFGISTKNIWRLSLGLGYQLNSHLVLKAEYMFERGTLSGGGPRNHEDMVAAEAAFKF